MQLDSSVAAVITGGASGLGKATAVALAARGVKVAIFDLNAQQGEAVAAEIGGMFCAVDVTSDTSVDEGLAGGGDRAILIIGRYVVDKVGDDQPGPFGTKIAPFRAHFDANDIGKTLIARGLARAPGDIDNGQAAVGTDADNKWIVSNVAW